MKSVVVATTNRWRSLTVLIVLLLGDVTASTIPSSTTAATSRVSKNVDVRRRAAKSSDSLSKKEDSSARVVASKTTSAVSAATPFEIRGGSSSVGQLFRRNTPTKLYTSSSENNIGKALFGVLIFSAIEYVTKLALKACNVSFPGQLAGCVALFILMNILPSSTAQNIYELLVPASLMLTKWMPIFFVPGLVLLPLSPSIGTNVDICKFIGVIIVGFYFSLLSTLGGIVSMRHILQKQKSGKKQQSSWLTKRRPRKSVATTTKSSNSPFSNEQYRACIIGSVVLGMVTVLLDDNVLGNYSNIAKAVFLILTTSASFMFGTRLPVSFNKSIHPLVTGSVLMLGILKLLSIISSGGDFNAVLRTYKTGSLHPSTCGAADLSLYILGPAVVSFAISMYARRQLIFNNISLISTAMIVSSAGGLYGTAAFVRLLRLGGSSSNASIVRLSTLARTVTTALALAIRDIMGGDISLVAATVCLSGIFGASYGKPLLDMMGVTDPVVRGLVIGSTAQGLGTASMSSEPEAFAFAAIAMVLTAVSATTIVSVPFARESLIRLATGDL